MVSHAACIAAVLERRASILNAGNNRDKAEVRGKKSKQGGSTGV